MILVWYCWQNFITDQAIVPVNLITSMENRHWLISRDELSVKLAQTEFVKVETGVEAPWSEHVGKVAIEIEVSELIGAFIFG